MNCSLLIYTAVHAPAIAPITPVVMNSLDLGQLTTFFWIKTRLLDPLCAMTPIRFVPLAILGGSPSTSMSIVSVMAEPEPANTLIQPATNPPSTAIIISRLVIPFLAKFY